MEKEKEYRILVNRARGFLELARDALEKGFYDHACFFAEQYVQLYLKALLYRVLGTYPRTHGIRELLSILLKTLSGEKQLVLSDYIKSNRSRISELEDAYIMATYTLKTYTRVIGINITLKRI